jgi:glycerol kinase
VTTILAVDQGTTSTKALLVSPTGAVVASASAAVRRSFPRPGWVEQDANELWESVLAAVGQLPKADIACIGLSAQRESVLVWDRATGRPLTPVVGWQCTRGAELCAELRAAGAEGLVRELTGLPLEPMFSASKLRLLLDAEPALRVAAARGDAYAGTIDSWLVWNLSGGALHVTDAGNAARTLLFDVQRLDWSDELLELFEIPHACLPAVVPSAGGPLGESSWSLARLPELPLAAVTADSHAALYGLGCHRVGAAKATFGTGSSVMSATGAELRTSHSGMATTVAWLTHEPTYALEGNIFSSGATVDWMAQILGLDGAQEVERLSGKAVDGSGVHVVPAFAGLGAPWWQPEARGRVTGLTFASGRPELARAAVESIAYQVADVVYALEQDLARPLDELRVDGGASRNDALLQLQADLIGCPVLRSDAVDAAALGAALLAAAAVGLTGDEPAAPSGARFEPRIGPEARQELLAAWHEAAGVARQEAAVR